jgi:hypothetical protein
VVPLGKVFLNAVLFSAATTQCLMNYLLRRTVFATKEHALVAAFRNLFWDVKLVFFFRIQHQLFGFICSCIQR